MMTFPEEFDSVFRYIVVTSRRAEQLMQGAKPRIESRHTKPTLIAKDEVDHNLVSWHVLTAEEIEAERQAMVEQYRAEVGADVAGEPARPIEDVLPTAHGPEGAEVLEEKVERDDEVARLARLLGLGGAAPGEGEAADVEAEGKVEDEIVEPPDEKEADEG